MNDTTALGALPEWDLGDLYPGQDSPELAADLTRAEALSKSFAESYEGRLAGLDGAALAAAIAEYEVLDEILGRVMSYAGLVHAGNVTDPEVGRFYQTMQERVNDIGSHTLFFTLELNKIEDADLDAKLSESEALAHYRPWLREVRAMRPHQLSDEIEKLLYEKSVAGRSAWVRYSGGSTIRPAANG